MPTAYADDFYSWALEQAAALRRAGAERVNTTMPIDWENLAEEIESMGKEQAWKLRSSYRVLLLHLLKWRWQPNLQSHSWRVSIARERYNAVEHLQDNPGLRRRRHELFTKAYRGARLEAAAETGLPLRTFPESCPFTLEQAMDEGFWPDAEG
jgi:hypothetical protein